MDEFPHYPPPAAPQAPPPQVAQYQARPRSSGFAIAALVLGILGFLYAIPAILGIIFGHVAMHKIKHSNGWVTGRGMAIAGFVCGYVWVAIYALLFIAALNGDNSNTGTYN